MDWFEKCCWYANLLKVKFGLLQKNRKHFGNLNYLLILFTKSILYFKFQPYSILAQVLKVEYIAIRFWCYIIYLGYSLEVKPIYDTIFLLLLDVLCMCVLIVPFVILWIFFRWIPFQRVWIEPILTKQERRVLLQGFPINWVVSKEVARPTNPNPELWIMYPISRYIKTDFHHTSGLGGHFITYFRLER